MTRSIRGIAIAAWALLLMGATQAQTPPQASGPRLALVVGEGAYANTSKAPETTAVNDAGLISYQLQQAGFDVTGGRDVDREGFESLAATFLAKLGQAGPNAVAVVYVSGLGLQNDGDNRIIPVDARLAAIDAVATETISVNELLAQLQSVPGAAHIAIFDLSRPVPFAVAPQIAPGLAPLDPQAGLLVAFSQQPGYVIEEQKQGYGAYASALAETIRVPGLSLDELFGRTRLRVQTITKGGQLPWNVSGLITNFTFFTPRTPVAPTPAAASLRNRPIGQLPIEDAFALAIERDAIEGYQQFIAAYPDGPLARRARSIIAARREAFFWRRSATRDTPEAYWTYLKHYGRGPHAGEARYRLSLLNEPDNAPATFYEEEYDIPAPPPLEVTEEYVPYDRWYALPPPPPPPVFFLPPPLVEFYELPPPPPAPVGFFLPPPRQLPPPPQIIPIPVPVPIVVAGKVPPLPLAVPPKPLMFQPGKAPPTPAQPVGVPLKPGGQFTPVGPGGPTLPKTPPGPTVAPAPALKPGTPPAPLPLPVPPGQPLPGKVPPGPTVAPAPALKPGTPPAPLPLPVPPGQPLPGKVPPGPTVAPAPALKPGTPPAPLPLPPGQPLPGKVPPGPTVAPAPALKPGTPPAPLPLPAPPGQPLPGKVPPGPTVAPAPALKPGTPPAPLPLPPGPTVAPVPALKPGTPVPAPKPSVIKPAPTPVPVVKPAPTPAPAIKPAPPPPAPVVKPAPPPPAPVAKPAPPPPAPVVKPAPPPPAPVVKPAPPPPAPVIKPAPPPPAPVVKPAPPAPGPKKPCTPEEHAKGQC